MASASNDQRCRPRHATPPALKPVRWAAGALASLAALLALGAAGASHAAPARSVSARPAARPAHALPQLPLTPEMLSRGAPPGARVLPARPVHVARPAPAGKPVIARLAANGIPRLALNAYRLAAARMASADPGCGIQWPLLAAIGRVESDHGRYGGALIYPNGMDLPPIIGIALNGTRSAYIGDTDGGRLDGDPHYDHAVGPMQFIPSTWAAWGVDGNADGTASPFDIDDATLAATRYLCAAGGDLRMRAGQVSAVLAYNDSDQYLAQVLALAAAYAAGVPVGSLPITGPTAGPLPPPSPWTGIPVNPAPPPGGDAGAPPPGQRRAAPSSTAGSRPSAAAGADTTGSSQTAPSQAAPASSAPQPAPHVQPTTALPTPSVAATSPSPRPTPKPVRSVVSEVVCTLPLPLCPSQP